MIGQLEEASAPVGNWRGELEALEVLVRSEAERGHAQGGNGNRSPCRGREVMGKALHEGEEPLWV